MPELLSSPDTPLAAASLSDEEIVRRVVAGDAALFEILMRRYNQRLYRVARGILRGDADTEDVMQQAYVNAYLHLAQFDHRARFSTWLTRIAIHEALARLRRQKRFEPADPEVEDAMDAVAAPTATPEQQTYAHEMRAVLETAISAIPEVYRTTFILREVEGLSTADVAATLDITEQTVKTRLHRARARLRTELCTRATSSVSDAFPFHLSRCDRVVNGVFAQLEAMNAIRH